MTPHKSIAVYLSQENACDYLPGQSAQMLVVSAASEMNVERYSKLIALGFRRSGNMVYRPQCQECVSCVPTRIPVGAFQPNRIQTRILKRNADLTVRVARPLFSDPHYALFVRYLKARHADGLMARSAPESCVDFLSSDWCRTSFYEFRLHEVLLAVAVVDQLDDALSAVYTFFDPDCARRSLGTFSVLWQIREAQKLKLGWLYLGYWIEHCKKMSYKTQYRPLEAYRHGNWSRFEKGEKFGV